MKRILLFLFLLPLFTIAQPSYKVVSNVVNNIYTDIYENEPYQPNTRLLMDGLTFQPGMPFGPGNYIPAGFLNFDELPYIIYKFTPESETIIDTVFRHFIPTNPITTPTRVYGKKRGASYESLLCEYTHTPSGWAFYPVADSNRVPLDYAKVVGGIGYPGEAQGQGDVYGTEIRFEGRVRNIPRFMYAKKKFQFRTAKSHDTYYWDWTQTLETPWDVTTPAWTKMMRYRTMGIYSARTFEFNDYMFKTPDSCSLQPTLNGWYRNVAFDAMKTVGTNPWPVTMSGPLDMLLTWPDADSQTVTMTAHGFSAGMAVRTFFDVSGQVWRRANATLPPPSDPPNFEADFPSYVSGVVSRVIDANHFVVIESGDYFNEGNPLGLLTDHTYYLANTTFGINYQANPPPAGSDLIALFKTDATGKALVLRSTNPADVFTTRRYNPVYFADRDNRFDPQSWAALARTAFIQVGALGQNASVPLSLLGVRIQPNQPWLPVDSLYAGRQLLKRIEYLNEVELNFWFGRYKAYFYADGRKLYAFLTAFYDADQGRIHWGSMANGIGVGCKTADPSISVLTPGMSNPSTSTFLGIAMEAERLRGRKPDGHIDFPADVINVHDYPKNGAGQNDSYITCGDPIELTELYDNMRNMVLFSRYYVDLPVYISETGWDRANKGGVFSRFALHGYGSYSSDKVIAFSHMRQMVALNSLGLAEVVYYQNIAQDTNSMGHFANMEMIRNEPGHQILMIGRYMSQSKPLDTYYPDTTLSGESGENKFHLYKYRKHITETTDSVAYVYWNTETKIPIMRDIFIQGEDSNGVTRRWVDSLRENTSNHTLTFPLASVIKKCTFRDGETDSTWLEQTIALPGTTYNITAGSVPIVIFTVEAPEAPEPPPFEYYKRIPGGRLKRHYF